jgi:seryl-tRNA synthetase
MSIAAGCYTLALHCSTFLTLLLCHLLYTRRGHSQKLEEQLQQAAARQAELQQQLEAASAQSNELGQLVGELQGALAEQAAAAQQQAGALQAALEAAQQQLQDGLAHAEQRVSVCMFGTWCFMQAWP